MSDHAEQAAYIIAPHINAISVMSLTTTTSGIDLSLPTELGPDVDSGKWVTLTAVGDTIYYFMNNSDTGTVDPAATSGATRAYPLANGASVSFVPRAAYHFVRARAATGTAFLHSYISSKPPNELRG